MSSPRGFLCSVCLLPAVAAMMVGCASTEARWPAAQDISQKRHERTQAAALQFDRQRDFAEFKAAEARWLQQDVQGCADALRRLLARNPDHVEARLLMAELLLAEHRPDEAIRYFQPAASAHADDARVQHMIGLLLDSAGQIDGALAHYQRAATLEPDNEVYAVSYQTALASGRPTGEPFQEFVPGDVAPPPPPSTVPPTGLDFARWPSPDEEGFAAIADRIDGTQDPGFAGKGGLVDAAAARSASELLQKGFSAMSDGMPDLGLAYFRDAMAAEPYNRQIPIEAAVSALRHNQPDLAVTLLEPSVEVFPESAAIRRILGTAYYRLGDYESSQVALRQALSLDKSSALSYFLMGCTLAKLGQSAAAEGHFQQAGRLDPRYAARR